MFVAFYRLLFVMMVLFALFEGGAMAARAEQNGLTYISENCYPFCYRDDGQPAGFTVDLLHRIWTELGQSDSSVRLLPWARGLEMVRNEPGTVLFAAARTPERERYFKWAGPILSVRLVLMSLKERGLKIRNERDLEAVSIGTVRSDAVDALLKRRYPKVRRFPVNSTELNMRKLLSGRVDAVGHDEFALRMYMEQHGLSPDRFEFVYVLQKTPVYFAFNRSVSDAYVKRFNAVLQRLRESGVYSNIWSRHGMSPPPIYTGNGS
ncbi:substrate-binding periplasmic protein [Pseudodesulfovibrio senegalensis]|uniref:Transporter substrate-binding domain-containing protein n=1 Tax=Pseudodesulfovibrio senegalensis TaxID=1721087 RepID=A0A6N6N296_9BACT|nr:transporter substrate-binding domain-containing protein [Pseudodesulfovibrio senegalensis]KAB1442129.1 transporter substrate-binding domain-containing protein [Pseudodesulfovibrio senegalensis]